MLSIDWRILVALAIVNGWICTALTYKWRQWKLKRQAKLRSARAINGEYRAEALLEREGYEIVERQLSEAWTVTCDDKDTSFALRADLLVCKDDRLYIAEVKTGIRAPNLYNAATRRQLLEYAVAYDSPTILLVDIEKEKIHTVRFPIIRSDWGEESEQEERPSA